MEIEAVIRESVRDKIKDIKQEMVRTIAKNIFNELMAEFFFKFQNKESYLKTKHAIMDDVFKVCDMANEKKLEIMEQIEIKPDGKFAWCLKTDIYNIVKDEVEKLEHDLSLMAQTEKS
tara:strand:+ start:782 stop:1135 length:354 start_codon:yes stop_codon:yes gene_type:complete